MYEVIEFNLKGVSPLLCHNSRLANPMDPVAKQIKEITDRKKKTDADLMEKARVEWFGSMYLDPGGKPCIPGENIEGMVIAAARLTKAGKIFARGILCDGEFPIIYKGPKTMDELWEAPGFRDQRMVRVQSGRVLRTRPKFKEWSLRLTIHVLPDVLNPKELIKAMDAAGKLIGLGDYRPKFGRFEIVTA